MRPIRWWTTIACLLAALAFVSQAPAAATIDRQQDVLTIGLDNAVRIEVKVLANGVVQGVGQVWWRDTLIKTDVVLQRPIIKTDKNVRDMPRLVDPLARSATAGKKKRGGPAPSLARLIKAETTGKTARLITQVVGADEKLVWEFRPHDVVINKRQFHGYGYAFHVTGKTNKLASITDNPSHSPAGTIENVWVMEQAWAPAYVFKKKLTRAGDLVLRACSDPAFKKYPALYDLSRPTSMFTYTHFNFRFQYGATGMLFLYSARPSVAFRTIRKQPGSNEIVYEHEYLFNRTSGGSVPEQIVLYCPELTDPSPLAVEDWHGTVYDFVKARQCEAYGVKPQRIVTMAGQAWSTFYWWDGFYQIRDYLKTMREWGFQSIWIAGGWHDGIYNRRLGQIITPLNLRPGANFGGEDMFSDVCRYAHSLDMKVICWMPTLYISDHSLMARERPDWWMRGADGMRNKRSWWRSPRWVKAYDHYSSNVFVDSRSSFGDYLLAACKHAIELGVDGFWFDSYPHPMIDDVGYKAKDFPSYQQHRMYQIHAELIQDGAMISYEGAGPLGTTSAGTIAPIIGNGLFNYQRVYGWQKLYWAKGYLKTGQVVDNIYYKSCANGIPAAIITGRDPKSPIHKDCPLKLAKWIIQANKDYRAVYTYMQYRHLIPSDYDPEQEKAVEWTNDQKDTIVLWSYEPFLYEVEMDATVKNVTTGLDVAQANGGFQTASWNTYLIRKQ